MSPPAKPRPRFPATLNQVAPSASGRPLPLRPQRLLEEAARDARRMAVPPFASSDLAPMRRRMIERLRAEQVCCEPVLVAMLAVPRHTFVDTALASQAYEDTSLPIGLNQTISKPSVVARMLEWLFLGELARTRGHLGRVLEIGTGCGYQTAVLARLSTQVVSVERLKPLYDLASRHLDTLAVPHCRLVYGDGMFGHPPNAPYDTIISAAGGNAVPAAWEQQLAPGGRLVAPTVTSDGKAQALVIIDRTPDGLRRTVGELVQFVPLKSGLA
jgi:protein-L-isoaspartate(D-aspartate) O-methyltransferase